MGLGRLICNLTATYCPNTFELSSFSPSVENTPNTISMESSTIIVEIPNFIRLYENGRVERLGDESLVPPSSDLESVDLHGVASKDVVIDPQTGVFVRLYLPRLKAEDGNGRVPVLVYVHGGGFCIGSAGKSHTHRYMNKVATEAKVICVSVNYRRTPEHRLPVAYDDCFGVLQWLDRQAMSLEGASVDPWLASHADFSKVFLTGDSAGANIVHQVGVRTSGRNWDRLSLQGAILVHPFFGGEEAIGCELEAEPVVEGFNKAVAAIWSISLPAGADRDHPFSNPVRLGSPALSTLVYPRMLVFVAGKDLLRDRGILYYESLKRAGKNVDLVIAEGEIHVFHLYSPESDNATLMLKRISEFVHYPSECHNATQNQSV